jgi:hypothetical protein
MSYQLQLASVPAPEADLDVFPFMNKLRQDAGEQPPSAMLKRFHDALAALFPDTPWSEGHYAGDAGRLTLVRRSSEVVPHVLYLAGELGLTVVDNQSGEVHRPPTYQVVLEGPAEGVAPGDAAARLAALMRKPVTDILALLTGGRRTVVKKGVPRYQASQYAAALRERAGCRATLAPEPGPVARPKPPAPAPAQAPLPAARPAGAPAAERSAALMPSTPLDLAATKPVLPTSTRMEDAVPPTEDDGTDRDLFLVGEGVRLICIAIGLNFLFRGAIQRMEPVPAAFSSLLLLAMTIYGCLRVTSGLGIGAAARAAIVLAVLAPVAMTFGIVFIPIPVQAILAAAVISLLILLMLGVTGTRRLKQAGFKVGLFGASKADVRQLGGMEAGERLQSTTVGWAVFIMVLLALMTGQMTAQQESKPLSATEVPCQFVGDWEVERDGGKHQIRIADNGTYSAIQLSGPPREGFSEYSGKWRYVGSSLYWSDEAFTPARKWANNVASVGQNEFRILDGSGKQAVFRLVQRGNSPRCRY